MVNVTLSPQEAGAVDRLLSRVMADRHRIPADVFLPEAFLWSHELPDSIRRLLYGFRLQESEDGLCVRGNPLDSDRLVPTPDRLRPAGEREHLTREDVLHILYAEMLGEPFAWSTIQNGYVVNDIIPIRGNEEKPLSSGSAHTFDLHTEDAFHPCAGDYLGLMCLRNPERVPTLIASITDVTLDPDVKRVLFEARYRIGVNLAHHAHAADERMPVLFGHFDQPYIRLNLNVCDPLDGDPEAHRALDVLVRALRAATRELVLQPGDCCYIDNYRVLHGRSPYSPRYDGNDRWLKRLYITSYLRRSRHLRDTPASRLVCPETAIAALSASKKPTGSPVKKTAGSPVG